MRRIKDAADWNIGGISIEYDFRIEGNSIAERWVKSRALFSPD